jgi:hypothetical protein
MENNDDFIVMELMDGGSMDKGHILIQTAVII